MSKNNLFKIFSSILLIIPLMVSAATKEEAKSLSEKAATYIEKHGIEASLPVMHDINGEFRDGELYVFVLQFDGIELINGSNPKLEGKQLNNLKDPNGTYLVREMSKVAQEKGRGWVNYMWTHPQSKKLTPKVSYVVRIGTTDTYTGVGIYLK